MTSPVLDYMNDVGPAIYYDHSFNVTLESCLEYLRKHPDTAKIQLDQKQVYRFDGDLAGLFWEHRIEKHLHRITMRVNGFTDMLGSTKDMTVLLVPNYRAIDEIRQLHVMTHVIN